MKSTLGDTQRLKHMLDCCIEIELAIGNSNEQSFIDNHVLRIAVVKWIEIIGEASVNITEQLKLKYNEVSWAEIKGLRNIIVHEYFGINYDLIWEVASEHIPILKEQIEIILKDIE